MSDPYNPPVWDAELWASANITAELLRVAKVALTWYEHPAMHDAFRNDDLLYEKLNTAIVLARVAIDKATKPQGG